MLLCHTLNFSVSLLVPVYRHPRLQCHSGYMKWPFLGPKTVTLIKFHVIRRALHCTIVEYFQVFRDWGAGHDSAPLQRRVRAGMNCIKIGLPGKLILSKEKDLWESTLLLEIVSENRFSGKTIFYTIISSSSCRSSRTTRSWAGCACATARRRTPSQSSSSTAGQTLPPPEEPVWILAPKRLLRDIPGGVLCKKQYRVAAKHRKWNA